MCNVEELSNEIKTCNKKLPYIFVSYKRGDAERVYPIVIDLQNMGVNIWIDKEMRSQGGKDWQEPAFDALECRRCKAVLFFVSKKSLVSGPVLAELKFCQEQFVKNTHKNGLDIIPYDLDSLIEEYGSIVECLESDELGAELEEKIVPGNGLKEMFPSTHFGDSVEAFCKRIINKSRLANFILDAAGLRDGKKIVCTDNKGIYDTLKDNYEDVINLSEDKCQVNDVNGEKKHNSDINEGDRGQSQDEEIREGFEIPAKPETVHSNPSNIVIQSDGKTYRITGKSYDAFYRKVEEDKYTILKGSRIRKNETYIPKKILTQYAEMITQDGYLLCDIEELPRSTAAKVIEGVSTNGQELLNEKKLLTGKVEVSFDDIAGASDSAVVKDEQNIKEDNLSVSNIESEGKITGPVGLGGLVVQSKASKANKLSLKEMLENGIVSVDDEVYVKGREKEIGVLTSDGCVLYKNEKVSLNKYVPKVLGPGSRCAYIFVYHKKTGKLLDELR